LCIRTGIFAYVLVAVMLGTPWGAFIDPDAPSHLILRPIRYLPIMGADWSKEDDDLLEYGTRKYMGDDAAKLVEEYDTILEVGQGVTKGIASLDYYPRYATGSAIWYGGVRPAQLMSDYAPGGYRSREWAAKKTGIADTAWGAKIGEADTGLRAFSDRLSREGVGWIQRDQSTTMGALNDRVMSYAGLAERSPEQTKTLEADLGYLRKVVTDGSSVVGDLQGLVGEARKMGDAQGAIEASQKLAVVEKNVEKGKSLLAKFE
jgi:hypothetical protein